MERKHFEFVCAESEEGRDAEVLHGEERGFVAHCSGDHLLAITPEAEKHCWDYRECEELYRTKDEFPWR